MAAGHKKSKEKATRNLITFPNGIIMLVVEIGDLEKYLPVTRVGHFSKFHNECSTIVKNVVINFLWIYPFLPSIENITTTQCCQIKIPATSHKL